MSRVLCRWKSTLVVFVSLFAATAVCSATTVSFSLGSVSKTVALDNGLDATVSLDAKTGSVNLTANVPQNLTLNTATLDTIPSSMASGANTLPQTLSITGPASNPLSRNFSQSVAVTTTDPGIFDPSSASAAIGMSDSMTFDLGAIGLLTVTPLGGSILDQTDLPSQFDNVATFLLTPVPEPGAVALLAIGAMIGCRQRRRGI
jgi:hypothetical protein